MSKTLQISHAVLFTCVKQCSACFFPEVCFVFEILRMQKNTFFARASSGDLLLDEKQKKPFVSLSDQVTIIPNALTTVSLVQADKALNGPDSNLFCRGTGSIRGRSIFFSFLFLYFFQKSRYLFKKIAYKAGVWRDF